MRLPAAQSTLVDDALYPAVDSRGLQPGILAAQTARRASSRPIAAIPRTIDTAPQLAETLGRCLILTYTTAINRGNNAGGAIKGVGASRRLSSSNWQFYLHYTRDKKNREEKT